jgi:hypothetical protein
MNCLHCKKPIVKYPAFSQYDPEWVHELHGMPWGSEYCEGGSPATRITNTIATPELEPAKPVEFVHLGIEATR